MTLSSFGHLSITFALAVSIGISTKSSATAAAAQGAPVPAAQPGAQPAAPVSLTSQALTQKGQAYKLSPDDGTWREFLETLRIYLSDGRTIKAPSQAVIAQNKALKDVQARCLDAGGARVWTFPGSQHNRCLVIQSGGGPAADGAPTSKVSIVAVPETVNVTAARIVKSFTTVNKPMKVGRHKIVQKAVKVEGPSMLAVAGLDRVSGLVYLGAFKPVSGTWVATSEPFSQIPSHFMQTLSGQASFYGNDLVLSVSSQTATPSSDEVKVSAPATSGLPRPKSSAYQIVLKFVGGHFVLSGSPGKDMPLSIVTYFVQCMRMNRMDLAKAWLAEPGLLSIPKYVGLIGKNSEPYKLVAMSTPGYGGARYRLVTNQKHDLILEVGKVKKDMLIKGVFIAPPDAMARNLAGTIIGAQPVTPPASTEGGATATPPAAKPEH